MEERRVGGYLGVGHGNWGLRSGGSGEEGESLGLGLKKGSRVAWEWLMGGWEWL